VYFNGFSEKMHQIIAEDYKISEENSKSLFSHKHCILKTNLSRVNHNFEPSGPQKKLKKLIFMKMF
jgi:hypothetical protein